MSLPGARGFEAVGLLHMVSDSKTFAVWRAQMTKDLYALSVLRKKERLEAPLAAYEIMIRHAVRVHDLTVELIAQAKRPLTSLAVTRMWESLSGERATMAKLEEQYHAACMRDALRLPPAKTRNRTVIYIE